jgi:hypothetical protein
VVVESFDSVPRPSGAGFIKITDETCVSCLEGDFEPERLWYPFKKVTPTSQEPAITAVITTTAMSNQPDTVSQFKNCFHMGEPFFEKDRFAVDTPVEVRSTGFSKMRVTRRETLLRIDGKSKEITKRGKELEAFRWDDYVVSVNGDVAFINLKIFTNGQGRGEENKGLQLKGEAVPHTGELVPLNDRAIRKLTEGRPQACHQLNPSRRK